MRLVDLAGRLTCTVPEAGQLLGIGRDAAYRAAACGQIPTLRLGRRLIVPVPRLLELFGADAPSPDMATAGVPTPAAALTHDSHGATHDRRTTDGSGLHRLRPA